MKAPIADRNSSSATKKVEQPDDAFPKLFQLDDCSDRDTSWWREASCSKICAGKVQGEDEVISQSIDHLFGNKAAKLTYRAYNKYTISSQEQLTVKNLFVLMP